MVNGTKKYKLAKFNKLGRKLYLDGLDPEKFSWVELNNIAWELGYREKPISYHFKLSRTTCTEGWMPIKNDAGAVEMTKLIPAKKRQISLYIIGGGRRKKNEAEIDDTRPIELNWHNPLNNVTAVENVIVVEDNNTFDNQINRCCKGSFEETDPRRVNVVEIPKVSVVGNRGINAADGGEYVADDNVISVGSDSESIGSRKS